MKTTISTTVECTRGHDTKVAQALQVLRERDIPIDGLRPCELRRAAADALLELAYPPQTLPSRPAFDRAVARRRVEVSNSGKSVNA